jgi:hypothetical protein
MFNDSRRIRREKKTVEAMIRLYCTDHHGQREGLCSECAGLRAYALERLERCPFQEGKTTCANCPVHCYRPVERERIRVVMRYSGPRMVWRHPILAFWHLVDGRRKDPLRPSRTSPKEKGDQN